ncbi:MAG: two-component system response regulator LytT [Flavobacteriales bacterium]|jgi:two-component system response regulator LytT
MANASVLVVEDESIVAKDIKTNLEKLGYKVVGTVATGEKAIEQSIELKPDIILMDIMLKGKMTGIEATAFIKENLNIPVVYLTANADDSTVDKAKFTEPHGYVIKPFTNTDLHTALEMALYKFSKEEGVKKERDLLYKIVVNRDNKNSFFVKSKSKLIKLNTSDIFYVEALKDYVVINTVSTRYTIHSTMKEIEKKLPSEQFLRVHRSYIVRIDKIVTIEQSSMLILEGEKKSIPIGGSYKEGLLEHINLF